MWLRDFLPADMEAHGHKVRILTFGYDSKNHESAASIQTFSKELLNLVDNVRTSKQERNRPIVFIGYDLGGLIIKQVRNFCRASGPPVLTASIYITGTRGGVTWHQQ